jgi:hypothetical protein
VSTGVTYTAVFDVERSTAEHLAQLLRDHRIAARTRKGRRALGCFRQAVLILRWFVDGTHLSQLACDHGLSTSTAYRYLHEGLTVLAAGAPDLATALERAKEAGLTHLNLDGTVIRTDRVAAPAPTARTFGGPESTSTPAGTCRSSPPRTAGRSGSRRFARAGSTTPPASATTA